MTSATSAPRRPVHQPALAAFAALGSGWVFVLVLLGALTTTLGAGMAFADWPLSNGSLNPIGWLQDHNMFAEHSHRLSGTMMGLITIALALWLWRKEARSWLRKLGWWALVIVIVQGLIGGQRVRLDAWHIGGFEMSVGQMLRIPHGILAQVYICILFAIAISLSRAWIENTRPVAPALRRLGLVCTALVLLQLVVAVTMRHNFAGLAIPSFPRSNLQGDWLPTVWSFPVAIHFTHRCLAVVLTVALVWFGIKTWTDRGSSLLMRCGASTLISLLAFQLMLGAWIIWSHRAVTVTTAHVLVGAATLATTFSLTWLAHRDAIETPRDR